MERQFAGTQLLYPVLAVCTCKFLPLNRSHCLQIRRKKQIKLIAGKSSHISCIMVIIILIEFSKVVLEKKYKDVFI